MALGFDAMSLMDALVEPRDLYLNSLQLCEAGSDPRNLAPAVYYGKGLMPDPATAHTSTTVDAFAGWKRATP